MNKRQIWFYSSLLIFLLALFLLATGSSLLNLSLNERYGIPAGTLITWAGIISLPLLIFWGVQKLRTPTNGFYKWLSILLKITIILSLLWMPICYLLAGNLSFSFSEKESFQGGQSAMLWFWRYSYGIAITPIVIWVVHLIAILFRKKK